MFKTPLVLPRKTGVSIRGNGITIASARGRIQESGADRRTGVTAGLHWACRQASDYLPRHGLATRRPHNSTRRISLAARRTGARRIDRAADRRLQRHPDRQDLSRRSSRSLRFDTAIYVSAPSRRKTTPIRISLGTSGRNPAGPFFAATTSNRSAISFSFWPSVATATRCSTFAAAAIWSSTR